MAGFTAIFSKNIIPKYLSFRKKDIFRHEQDFLIQHFIEDHYLIEQSTNRKFLQDKVFLQDDDCIIVQEGVILNLETLTKQHQQKDAFQLIKSLYHLKGGDFVNELRGDFSGFIYTKTDNKCFVFTNHTGSKRIFHYHNDSFFIFSSDLGEISHLMGELGEQKKLNIQASYLLLTCGFMLEDHTLVDGVKKLMPGNYLTFDNNIVVITEYFHLRNIHKTTDTKEEIIEKMDQLFANAIKREFEKDLVYGYKHMATLSGGLDSRMTVLMAHKLGYIQQLNFTFSQANYLDEKIAKRIAVDFHHDFIFQSLDYGNYLKEIEKSVYLNDGLILYSGSAHVLHAIQLLNFNEYGLIHTGIIGDAVIGSFLTRPYAVKPGATDGMYSTFLAPQIKDFITQIINKYPDEELYKFYSRGFLAAMNGNYTLDLVSQGTSPFLDVDFLSYCVSIPENLKFKQKIYLEWMASKHPEFARYPWEKTGVSPLKSTNFKKYLDFRYYHRMSLKLFDKLSGKMKSGMNPFDYWMSENSSLNNYIHSYFSEHIHLLNQHSALKENCIKLFNRGNSGEKFQVITLLAAIKLHFQDEK